jgi:autotransporter-associated beta strand protein
MNTTHNCPQLTKFNQCRWLALLLAAVLAPMLAQATITGPYTADANTLILLHLDDAAGGTNAAIASGSAFAGTNFISVNEATATTTPPPVTTVLGATAYPGFGTAATFPSVGIMLAFDGNGNGSYQGDSGSGNSADAIPMSKLNIGNGGQTPFTLEALIAPATIYGTNMEIISTDSYASNRGFQFRINSAGQLEFNEITSGGDVVANIPVAGPHAFVANAWYHVAVTYDGAIVRLYWTKMGPSVGQDNLIGSAPVTIGSAVGAYTGPLVIGNANRGAANQAFFGAIDEVRISNVARAANQMMFTPRTAQALAWVGDGANNAFADGVVSNWNNGTASDVFNAGDTVSISDSSANTNISLWGYSLLPAAVTISNSASPILLQGAGGIGGSASLTKLGSGTLTLGGINSYSGATTISNGTVTLASAPLLYLSFDNTNGTTVLNEGIGGSALNGTLTGTATIVTGGRRGKALNIPSGTATAAYVLVNTTVTPLNVTTPSNTWTVAMWLKTSTAGAVYLYQGGSSGWSSGETEYYLENGTAGDGAGTHAGGVRYAQGWQSGTAVINDGNWHFVVMTCNGGIKTSYVDGTVDAWVSGVNQWSGSGTGGQLRIGGTVANSDSQVALNGLIDEFYMYNRCLSQAEIQGLMTLTNAPAGADLPAVATTLPAISPVAIASGATLNLNGYSQTNSGLSGAGTLDSTLAGQASTLTISNTGKSYFSGNISNSGGAITNNTVLSLVKLGTGTQILSGINGYAGGTTVANGTLVLTNNGTINVSSNNADNLIVGSVSGQSAALYQYAGTTVSETNVNLGGFQMGGTAGAYGYYNISGGTINVGGELDTGGSGGGNGTFGQFDMSGGTVNLPNSSSTYFLGNRANSGTTAFGESSVINFSGGTVQIAGGGTPTDGSYNGLTINWAGGNETNTTTISGTAQFLTPSLRVKLNEGTSFNGLGVTGAGNVTALNLNGGVLQTLGFLNGTISVNPNVNINFNGGTLKAGTAGNANFLSGIAGAFVYSGGATINDNGMAITNGQALLTPSGNGVSSIAVPTGGSGYIVPPQVIITGGGGSNATAYATISGGAVTGITVTSPGNNYSSAPTVTLAGGGYASAATVGTVSIAANASGGLTKLGTGSLTLLNTANTYTGNTVVGAGELFLDGTASLASGNIMVSNNATFDVSELTSGFTLASGQNLLGSGTNNGSISTVSGANIYAGTTTGYGTNTFNSNLTVVSGAATHFNLGTTYNGANGFINVGGSLTDNGAVSVSAPSTSVNLDTTADYVLITAAGGISGTVSATPIWGTKPLNWRNYTVIQSGNNIQLHYTSSTPPVATGTASPATAVNNQNVFISVTVTPGTGSIDPFAGVTLDASPVGLSTSVPLELSATANVYTNTITIPATVLAGPYTLTATITDSTPLTGTTGVGLTVVVTNDIWNGAGSGNFSDNSDWISTFAPAYVGDSLTFAGTAGLTPNVDQNYTVTGITFSNTAGSFNIGTSGSTLTLTNSGSIVNNSANIQTLNVPIADAGGGLSYSGAGSLTLSANNTYTGPTTVSSGTLNVSGTLEGTGITTVGTAATNAILMVSGSMSPNHLLVGNVTNGVGAVYQTGGTISATSGSGGDLMSVGNIMGGFGYFDSIGGTVTANGMAVGGENNTGSGFSGTGGNGIMEINGGTVNDAGWFVMARGATTEIGVLNVFSGTLNYAGGGLVNCWGSGGQTAIVNILGGTVANTVATVGFNLNQSLNLTNTGILNLNGGIAQASGFVGSSGALVNFNGGNLQASENNSSFLTGLGGVNIYSGGATINDNGYTIGVSQPLLAPTGNGVNGIASYTPGAGYIASPIVIVNRGAGDTTGVGATAVAQVDVSTGGTTSGQVTNVVITSPGVNYTATPTFTLIGGGATTPATITGTAPTANSSGGFTKTGSGTLTLAGSATYAGSTTVSNGTLKLVGDALLHMTFDNVSGTTVVNDGAGGAAYNGTLTGTATVTSGGRFGNALSIPSGVSTNAYVLINSPVVNFNNSGTWSWGMWIQTTTAGGCYMFQGSNTWGSAQTSFYLNNGGGGGTHMGGVRYAQGWEEGTAVVNDGNWHFIAMTCTNGTKTMYVDGNVDVKLVDAWSGNGSGNQLRIGGNGGGEASGDGVVGLGGLIDEVYIYNRVLSQAEIQSLHAKNSGITSVLPSGTAANVASGATLDLAGLSQTVSTLTGAGGVTLGDEASSAGNLTVGNASNMEFDGVISDAGAASLTKVGTGALLLTGANTYAGSTTVSNGTLLVDGSLAGPVTVTAGANLGGLGTINGVTTVYGSLSAGSNSVLGQISFENNLVFDPGAIVKFSLTTSASGVNDQAVVYGSLTGNNNVIHISAPSTSISLDTADYVLIDDSSGSGITGGFISTPVWDVRPVNYQNYTIQNIGGQIVLHYSVALPPTATISLNPSTVSRNQNSIVSVNAMAGSNPISSVTLDTSSFGGSTTLPLVEVGSTTVYTNTVAVPANYSPGAYFLLATITDAVSLNATVGTNLTVVLANDVWTGAGTDGNWDTNPNWVNSAAPGLSGDGVTFAGTTDLAPTMDQNYAVSSVTFSNNAGSFNITNSGYTLTLTNGSSVTDNSTNAQTLNVPVVLTAPATVTAAAGTLTLAGTIDNGGSLLTVTGTGNTILSGDVSDNGGLTKSGNGSLTLAATNTYVGSTVLNAGKLNIPVLGAVSNSAINVVGGAAGNAVLTLGGSLSQEAMIIGNANGAAGAVYQTNGIFSAATATTLDNLAIGNVAGAYGYYDAIGGNLNSDGIAVGGENNNPASFSGYVTGTPSGNGLMEINGGTVTDGGWLVMARGSSNQVGVLNVYSGSLTFAGGGLACNWGTNQTSIINILGGSVANASASTNLPLNFNAGTGDVGILNCNGGSIQAGYLEGSAGQVNFNGGTLAVSENQAVLMSGLASAYVYGGGATINNNGHAVSTYQPFLAPTGYGVSLIGLSSNGSGYIAPPIVTISGGSGSGATAIAHINPVSGTVTNIQVTSAGNNYLSTDTLTVTFTGGGGSGATASTPVLTANTSGGLTSTGSGTLTLTGSSTYTGNTTISSGTLALGSGGSIGSSANINVTSGATFDVSAISFALNPGQTLAGNGTVNGSVTNNGTMAPGTSGTIGALTFNNNLTLNSGGATAVKLNESLSPSNDVIAVSGAVTFGGTLAVSNLGGSLHAGDTFQLFSKGGTGGFTITGSPGTGLAYSFNPTSGVLNVVNGVNTNAATANFQVVATGSSLAFTWAPDHKSWQLYTNSVGLTATNSWFPISGSASVTNETLNIDPSNPNVFFQLRYP